MARQALSSRDHAGHLHQEAELRRKRHKHLLRGVFTDQTFEQLTKQDKDLLLKTIAVSMGLVKPSDG